MNPKSDLISFSSPLPTWVPWHGSPWCFLNIILPQGLWSCLSAQKFHRDPSHRAPAPRSLCTAQGWSAARVLRCSVTSDSVWPCGLWSSRLLCPWGSPRKDAGLVCCQGERDRNPALTSVCPGLGLHPPGKKSIFSSGEGSVCSPSHRP